MAVIGSVLLLLAANLVRAQAPPEWTVNPAEYEHFMTVTAELIIDGEVETDSNTVVAAFMNGECRGVAQSSVIEGQAIYFLMVYGNTINTDVYFRTYYASLDTILDLTDSLAFQSGGSFGSPGDPHPLTGTTGISAIGTDYPEVMQNISLAQNFPNPFNPSTTIAFTISVTTSIQLAVYDIKGDHVRTLANREMSPGNYIVRWDGRNDDGSRVSVGTYFYRLSTPNFRRTRKMVLLK